MLKSFLPLFAMTFFICLFIVLMQFLWRYIDDLVGKGLDVATLGELFFYAAEENCITRVVAQQGVSETEAIDRIARIDKYRANYYKYFTGRDWNDVRNYDFCIDTSSMDYDKLIRVVKAYLAERKGV